MTSAITINLDPAAVFACALSLWEECRKSAARDNSLDLGAAYNGWDELMREVMRIGHKFEEWACEHVRFDNFDEVWPYMLADRFGGACLQVLLPTALASFDEYDCIRVALRLGLLVDPGKDLPVPIDVMALNPLAGAGFKAFRIQTVRCSNDEHHCVVPFTSDDDPFDEQFDRPFFGLYGITETNETEHITNRETYLSAVELVTKLAPGIHFPQNPTSRPDPSVI